jgi:hypothetical protein
MHTRSVVTDHFGLLNEEEKKDWIADGPRVIKLMRTMTDDVVKLTADIRRAYRTKPISWMKATFEPRLKSFRDQSKWFTNQLRRHPAVIYRPEFIEMELVVKTLLALLVKVQTNA